MSGSNMSDLQTQVNQHDRDIEVLKNSVQTLVTSIDKLATTNSELTTQFAVYCQKHDANANDILDLKEDVKELRDFKSAVKPFIEGARAVMWKFLGANIVAVGAASAVVASISKMG